MLVNGETGCLYKLVPGRCGDWPASASGDKLDCRCHGRLARNELHASALHLGLRPWLMMIDSLEVLPKIDSAEESNSSQPGRHLI